jgi:Phage integrase family
MAKSHLKLVTPATVKRTVMPSRRPNGDLRSREYLTEAEVESAYGGRPAQPLGPPGCHHDACRLQAWPTGVRALRRLQREQGPRSAYVFTSERGAPFTIAGFARMVERAGIEAKLAFKVHPHMLRHACGYALANRGHDTRALQAYLGHKNIQHTVCYTELSPTRFKDFWRK